MFFCLFRGVVGGGRGVTCPGMSMICGAKGAVKTKPSPWLRHCLRPEEQAYSLKRTTVLHGASAVFSITPGRTFRSVCFGQADPEDTCATKSVSWNTKIHNFTTPHVTQNKRSSEDPHFILFRSRPSSDSNLGTTCDIAKSKHPGI